MDLGAYWQENRRFVLTVGAGVVAFLVGFWVENALFQGKIVGAQRAIQLGKNKLAELRFTSADLTEVEAENAALRTAVERLTTAARFAPRPEFVPDPASGPSAKSVSQGWIVSASRSRASSASSVFPVRAAASTSSGSAQTASYNLNGYDATC